jgi:hypothetical protein
VVFVIVVFVVCVFPDTILATFFKTGYYEASYLAKGIREITGFLLLLVILYSIFNKQFAKHTKELLRYTFRERRRKTTNDETVPLSTRCKDSTVFFE